MNITKTDNTKSAPVMLHASFLNFMFLIQSYSLATYVYFFFIYKSMYLASTVLSFIIGVLFFYVVLWLSDENIAYNYFNNATIRNEKCAYRNLCKSVNFRHRSTKLSRSTMFAISWKRLKAFFEDLPKGISKFWKASLQ